MNIDTIIKSKSERSTEVDAYNNLRNESNEQINVEVMKKDSMTRATDISVLGLSSYEHDRCFLQQIKCICYFYIVNVFNELLYWLLGMYMLDND
jgi:hypothetical protein